MTNRTAQPLREELVARLWRAASTHVKTLETRMEAASEPDESTARTMAVLVKTLRDLAAFDGAHARRKAELSPGLEKDSPEQDDASTDDPREIDEFRRELARRIAALDGGSEDGPAGRA